MSNNEFKTIGLYDHNAYSYKKIKEAYESGKDVVGIVHATGTGKSYNALQLAYDNKDKKIVYIVPSNGIIEHIKKIIEDNPNLDMERDFPNLEFRTYQSFVSLDAEEIADIDCDLLFLDEFHHIGAPVWGARINTMIETHPNAKIFGMTAYTVRDRGTPYERDMANPDTDELFSGKIESRYDLCDAMIDGVLPKPIYKSAYINLIGLESKLEEKVQKLGATTREYQEYIAILSDAKRRIQEAPSIPEILRKSIKPNGKYIYFCPPCSEAGTNDIETIKKQAIEWFREFVPEEDIIIYTSTSDMGEDGKLNRNAFYDDITLDGEKVNNKLRVMFAINQYNEGIHAPNVDGVIMGRGTTSDIVFFEQLGRALSVRGNTKEMFEKFEEYTIDGLRAICKSRGIPFKENANKEDLIERLIAPVVIDLTNNYEFIKKLENNLRDRIKEIQTNGLGSHRDIKIRDASFDIEIENQDLFEMLKYISDRLTTTWEDNYALAEAYYKEYHNLLIPSNFITNDGITRDEEGVALGEWIRTQRKNYSELSEERTRKLQEIGFVQNVLEAQWQRNYDLAKAYYNKHHNLLIPQDFITNDGVTCDEEGLALGEWISRQRRKYSGLSEERKRKLQEIGFIQNALEGQWQRNYALAEVYYNKHHNLLIPKDFITNDGVTRDEEGVALGVWISTQRIKYSELSEEKKKRLQAIGFVQNSLEAQWQMNYAIAEAYYNKYHNLLIPQDFMTNDGVTRDENGVALGEWISRQRRNYSELSEERKRKLQEIGFVQNPFEAQWQMNYALAKAYYNKYHNLLIPKDFMTNDGATRDEEGVALGEWIRRQRREYSELSEGKKRKLQEIGFIQNALEAQWQMNYAIAEAYYNKHHNLLIPIKFITIDGITYDEEGVTLGHWIAVQRRNYSELSEERKRKLQEIGFTPNTLEDQWQRNYALAEVYYNKHHNLLIPTKFITTDGITYDEDGVALGVWISTQRRKYSELSEERKRKLQEIGFVQNAFEAQWQMNYALAEAYYTQNHNLLITQDFKTIDGLTYDENGVALGHWIAVQRRNYSELSEERKRKLQEIGMVWDNRLNKAKTKDICTQYMIDMNKNKEILSHISFEELQAKIDFLKTSGIPITNANGVLCDIFNMSSEDMKEKYGISMEELIRDYLNKNDIGRGV